jgi:hypothetical protein
VSSILKNIFGRKPQDNSNTPAVEPTDNKIEEKPLEKKTETFAPKSIKKVVRGADGKFTSKGTSAKKAVQVKKITVKTATASGKEELASQKTIPNCQTLTFYGKRIRKIHRDSSCYFALEDILPIAIVDDPESFVKKLQENESVKDVFANAIMQIKLSDENGTKMVDCVDYAGFMSILPIIRDSGHMFPGPFPDWLRDISKLP